MLPEKFTARLLRWNSDKGYGFLKVGAHDVFLHVKDILTIQQRVPEAGDVFQFTVGIDYEGRRCARQAIYLDPLHPGKPSPSQRPLPFASIPRSARRAAPSRQPERFSLGHASLLFLLLLCPIFAVCKLAAPIGVVPLSALAVSIITYLIYALDKLRAESQRWRISEATLHTLSALGGWPGAFVAQHRLRHKVAKPPFLAVFWLTVAAYQFIALDFLLNWKLSHAAFQRCARFLSER